MIKIISYCFITYMLLTLVIYIHVICCERCTCLTKFLQVVFFWHAKTCSKNKRRSIDAHILETDLWGKNYTRQVTQWKFKWHILLRNLTTMNCTLSIWKTQPMTLAEIPKLTYKLKFNFALTIFFYNREQRETTWKRIFQTKCNQKPLA